MLHRFATLLLMLLLGSCGGGEKSPETRIRELLTAGEQAVESRSVSAVSPLLSAAFNGRAGEDKRAVLRLLAGYFVTHQSIHLLSQVSRLELLGEQRAEVTLFVAAAGQPLSGLSQLPSMRADLIRLDLTLLQEQGEWQVLNGTWRRAEKRDFLE